MPIQIILVFSAVLGALSVVLRFRSHEVTRASLVAWLAVWSAVAIVAIVPNSTAQVAKIVGVGRGVDLVIYASLVILFFLVFRCLVTIEKMRREITVLVREIALHHSSEKNNV
jgi:hypothetical protein